MFTMPMPFDIAMPPRGSADTLRCYATPLPLMRSWRLLRASAKEQICRHGDAATPLYLILRHAYAFFAAAVIMRCRHFHIYR